MQACRRLRVAETDFGMANGDDVIVPCSKRAVVHETGNVTTGMLRC